MLIGTLTNHRPASPDGSNPGATDLVIDPQQSNKLYASFLGQGISKTVDSGANWTSVMTGFPVTATFDTGPTRFSLGLSRPWPDATRCRVSIRFPIFRRRAAC